MWVVVVLLVLKKVIRLQVQLDRAVSCQINELFLKVSEELWGISAGT